MIDDLETLGRADESGFLAELAALPGSYDGPDGRRPAPYGLRAEGEARAMARALAPWVDGAAVTSGTQFVLAAGFGFSDPGRTAASDGRDDEAGGDADLVEVGWNAAEPALRVDEGVLSPYTYAAYLAYATGRGDVFEGADRALRALAERAGPAVPTESNPVKTLAWALWNRVPLLLSDQRYGALQAIVQEAVARVGKGLTVPTGDHPLAVATSALEARHALGDDMVGLVLGPESDETRLLREVVASRVAQVESLGEVYRDLGAPDDPGAEALLCWYAALWVGAYLALLHGLDPAESPVYRAVGAAL